MSPPAPETCGIEPIGAIWTEEQVITILKAIQNTSPGASLPHDVTDEINPYLYQPSNLPEDIWCLVYSEDPKQSESGFWKPKGDSCQVYSDSSITGWRTTLQFYSASSPNGNPTDWMMQRFSITHNGSTQPKGGDTSLCRVFLCHREGESKKPVDVVNESKSTKPIIQSKLHAEMEMLYAECFSEGDFLELDDLDDPHSSSSSSENSSCVTPLSDLYFNTDELLQLLEPNSSSNRFTVSRPNDMVLTVAPRDTTEPVKVEELEPGGGLAVDKNVPEKNQITEDTKKKLPAVSDDGGASSSRKTPRRDKGKKVYSSKTIKKFFCFLA